MRKKTISIFRRCYLLNFKKIVMIKHVSNTVTINLQFNNLFKLLIKENRKYVRLIKFLNYWTHNKNEIKGSSKIRVKTKGSN